MSTLEWYTLSVANLGHGGRHEKHRNPHLQRLDGLERLVMAAKYNYSQNSAVAFAQFGVAVTDAMQMVAAGATDGPYQATNAVYEALDVLLAAVREDIMNDVRSIYGG